MATAGESTSQSRNVSDDSSFGLLLVVDFVKLGVVL